jgi:hypothetical protein
MEEEFRKLTLQIIGEAFLSLPPQECDRVHPPPEPQTNGFLRDNLKCSNAGEGVPLLGNPGGYHGTEACM